MTTGTTITALTAVLLLGIICWALVRFGNKEE